VHAIIMSRNSCAQIINELQKREVWFHVNLLSLPEIGPLIVIIIMNEIVIRGNCLIILNVMLQLVCCEDGSYLVMVGLHNFKMNISMKLI
jgi:hypothetical protein